MGWFRRSEHLEEQLSAYIDGELDARQAEKVACHLAACPQCTTLLEELRSAKTMLSELPREAPRRSFVLGPEHARPPVPVRAPSRKSSFSFAPAVAATVLIGLLLADAISLPVTSQDESASSAGASEMARQTVEDASSEAPVPAIASGQPGQGTANSSAGAGSQSTPAATRATAPDGSAGAGTAPSVAPQAPPVPTVLLPPATGDNAPSPSGPLSTFGADAPRPAGESDGFADKAAASEDEGSGLSTLRVLQILAAIALVGSVFYVYVRPRLFERK